MTSEELFLTGVFEGEGSIVIIKQSKSAALVVSMTDFDIIERFQQAWGGQVYLRKQQSPKWKPAWRWQLGVKSKVKEVLEKILPYLSERRSCKALDAFDRLECCYENYGK